MVLPLSAGRIRMWGLDLRKWRDWHSSRVRLLLEGRDLVKLGWESGQDVGDVKFEGVGGGELRRVSLAGFMELGKAGMDRAGIVCRVSSN